MVSVHTSELELHADYTQFYVVDPDAGPRADLVWDGRGLERHLGVSEGIVAVGTVGYTIPVRLELWDAEPPPDLDAWDHVTEATLETRSGRIAVETVNGPVEDAAFDVAPGTYRVRAAASGLADAGEMDGGDAYRVQIWPAPPAEPQVLRWWSPWDPAGAVAQPTIEGSRLLLGAEADDARMGMQWLASAGRRHLFMDADGALWEHTNLSDTRGTPQLEELDAAEAERRYGPSAGWGRIPYVRPPLSEMARTLWQAWRHSRGRRRAGGR